MLEYVEKVVGVKLEDNCILDDGLKEIVIPDDSADRYNFQIAYRMILVINLPKKNIESSEALEPSGCDGVCVVIAGGMKEQEESESSSFSKQQY